MILIEEAIQRVQSLYSKGISSKDGRLSDRHIYSCLISARATLAEQGANKRQHLSPWNYTTLPCVELQEAMVNECPCVPDDLTILRSKIELPRVISYSERPLIYSVTTLDNEITFDRKEYNTYKYKKGSKYTSGKPFYMITNGGHIFIGVTKKLKAVSVRAMCLDPYEAYMYPSACEECNDCKCKSPFELPFPVDGESLSTIIQLASKEAIYLFSQMKEDKTANATDDGNTLGSMVHQPEQ